MPVAEVTWALGMGKLGCLDDDKTDRLICVFCPVLLSSKSNKTNPLAAFHYLHLETHRLTTGSLISLTTKMHNCVCRFVHVHVTLRDIIGRSSTLPNSNMKPPYTHQVTSAVTTALYRQL